MIELPKGLWRWIEANTKDLGRIARAAERIADELAEIRKTLQDDKREDERS